MEKNLVVGPLVLLAGLILIAISQSVKQPEYSKYTMDDTEFNRELNISHTYLGIGVFVSIIGSLIIGKNNL